MTTAAQNLIQSFEVLTEQDQREVLIELLRWPIEVDYQPLSDDDLRHSADQIFLEYDEREAQG